jgi:hypothetical protein
MASREPIAGRCAAKVSVSERNPDGGYCELPPMAEQARCGSHGGRAPQSRAAAERRQQEQAAAVYVAKYGMPTAIEWHEAIQTGLDETYGNVLALRDLVQQLSPQALTWGESQVVTVGSSQFPGVDVTQAAGIAPVVALYGQERDRLHRMAVDAGKLGLEARRQAFTESQAVDAVEAMRRTFADSRMKATPEQLELGPRILAENLRALGASS